MVEDETNTTPPPTTANITEGSSSPATPVAKRARMTSPAQDEAPSSPTQPESKNNTTTTASTTSATGNTVGIDEHEDVDDLEAVCELYHMADTSL